MATGGSPALHRQPVTVEWLVERATRAAPAADAADITPEDDGLPGVLRTPAASADAAAVPADTADPSAGAISVDLAPDLPLLDVDPAWIGLALRIMVLHARREAPADAAGEQAALAIHAHGNADAVVLTLERACPDEPGSCSDAPPR